MIKTIPVIYRSGVFVPLKAVDEIAEETSLEIEVHLPIQLTFTHKWAVGKNKPSSGNISEALPAPPNDSDARVAIAAASKKAA